MNDKKREEEENLVNLGKTMNESCQRIYLMYIQFNFLAPHFLSHTNAYALRCTADDDDDDDREIIALEVLQCKYSVVVK